MTKFKKIIGMKKIFAQNMEVPVSLMKFLYQTQDTFGVLCLFESVPFMMVFSRIGLSKPFRLIFS